jgi:L-ascorbate metabolism protein UlaG (beta-lactamase superfamily)
MAILWQIYGDSVATIRAIERSLRRRGNGYVITVTGTRLYVAGDTGCTPEMMGMRDIDVAFVP